MEMKDFLAMQKKRRGPNKQEERSDQISFILWMRMVHPKVLTIISPINKFAGDAKQQMIQAVIRKKMGYIKGTLDVFIPKARKGYNGLFLEFKKEKDGKVSPEQVAIIEMLQADGYKTVVCFGYDEAVKAVQQYL